MAKILVTDSSEGTKSPFLRGILTRSLHEAGLSFEDAYKLASQIRQELGDGGEIASRDLRELVISHLKKAFGSEITQAYESSRREAPTILIRDQDDQVTPFSRSRHHLCLESCGLSNEDAVTATARVYEHLISKGEYEVSSGRIGHLTYCCLAKLFGQQAARRYMVWVDYTHSGRPLILLVGGATGSGKSTIATEIAHRLGIVRTQSTDMLREVMRMMVPQRLLPVLHRSSFNAWQALPAQGEKAQPAIVADGFRSQAELLFLPCEAVIQRALRERVSLILEGVHAHPVLAERISTQEDAIIVPVMLAVLKQKDLKKRLQGRGLEAPKRQAEQQLSFFDAIWELQKYLLAEADRANVPIIANEDKEEAIHLVLRTIINALEKGFSGTSRSVFV